MRLIGLAVILAVSFVFAPLDSEGQQTRKIQRVGVLGGQSAESCDRYILLDSVDWMDVPNLITLWRQIRRTARPDARVIFRTAAARSPLEHLLPPGDLEGWHCHAEEGREFLARDRAAIYGGFHLYSRD